jgi:hypothetical protein
MSQMKRARSGRPVRWTIERNGRPVIGTPRVILPERIRRGRRMRLVTALSPGYLELGMKQIGEIVSNQPRVRFSSGTSTGRHFRRLAGDPGKPIPPGKAEFVPDQCSRLPHFCPSARGALPTSPARSAGRCDSDWQPGRRSTPAASGQAAARPKRATNSRAQVKLPPQSEPVGLPGVQPAAGTVGKSWGKPEMF